MSNEPSYAKLSEQQLKDSLVKAWHRAEESTRQEMAPMLYHLRLKLRAPGRKGMEFEVWVEENLGINIRTANCWASWHEKKIGGVKATRPRKGKLSLGQMAEPFPDEKATQEDSDVDEPEPAPEDMRPVHVQLMLTEPQEEKFRGAMEVLGDRATAIIFHEVVSQAAASSPVWSVSNADSNAAASL
jgi:hypothetical protein